MIIKQLLKYTLFINFLCFSIILTAQKTFTVKGKVIDATTKESIPFASLFVKTDNSGTSADIDGFFKLSSASPINEIQVSSVGYKSLIYKVKGKDSIIIRLESDVALLQEVVVKPPKYRNKNNPTVELIRRVVDNRKKNRVEGFESYQEEQYEKILLGLTDLSDKVKNNKMLRTWKNFTSNTDTTLLKGSGITPVFLQESVQDFYSQRKPKRSKIWVRATQKIKFPIMDDKGVEKYLRYLYQDADIYDDYVELLTDHFISPIADNAPLFYRYYPADTVELSGSKIVRLQFFPRNKTDMLLQGELFIALDSTYPVTRITYSVNPNINLNWVRKLEMDQIFKKIPSGKWVLAEENYILDFGATQKGIGVFAKRYVSHINQQMGVKLKDTIFQKNYELRTLAPSAENKDTTFWKNSRHTNLTATEANTYKTMDSLKNTLLFKRVVKSIYIIATGHIKPAPGLEIGRVNTFYSFNPVEGTRLRFGARTNPDFSKRVNFETYGAYGFKDQRWKFGVAANITLAKDRAYNRFPYNMLRVNYQQDLLTPGVLIIGAFAPTSIASSFTRGTNDRFFFQKKFLAQYEREYFNHFSFIAGFEHKDLSSLGSLKFIPTDDKLKDINNVISAKPFIQLRYAPGEAFYESTVGWRQRIKFQSITQIQYSRGIKGFAGSQYNFDEINASYYKFSNTPPMGYNYFYFESGAILGKVPYPLLTVHRGNQTFGYRFMAYNLMNFMEFVSDRYASVNIEQSFYGFFTNKIPLVRKLKLREYATFKMLYGTVSDQNKPTVGSGLYEFPKYADGAPLTYTLDKKPYIEASVGLGNIFKIIRLDLVRRFTYLEHPQTAKYGVRVAAQLQF
jgi:hypothetical protein